MLDSLDTALAVTTDDTAKANLLIRIAFETGLNDNPAALVKARQALHFAGQIGYERGVVDAKKILGRLHYEKGALDSAMIYYSDVLPEYQKRGDQIALANMYRDIAQVHLELRQFADAEKYYRQSADIARQSQEPKLMGNAHNSIGILYLTRGFSGDEEDSLASKEYLAKAAPYFEEAIEYFTEAGYDRGIALAYGNLGILSYNLSDYRKALDFGYKALDKFTEMDEKIYQSISYIRIAEAYVKLKKLNEAQEATEKALAIGKETNNHYDLKDSYFILSNIMKEKERYAEALEYYQLFTEYHNKIVNEESQSKINELEQAYRANERELEIENLSREKELQRVRINRQRIMMLLSAVTLLSLGGISFLLYRSNRHKTRTNELLIRKNEEIQKKNELLASQNQKIVEQNNEINQKSIKLQELYEEHRNLMLMVAHDLQSPFNKIKGLANILSLAGTLNKEQDEIISKIDQVSETGRQLISDITSVSYFESDDLNARLKAFRLNYLLRKIQQEHESYANKKNIQLVLKELENDLVIETDRDFFTRIMDNLISNAIKYSPANKKVYINPRIENHHYLIEVRDEGPGISDDDKKKLFKKFQRLSARPTGGENSTGLGLSIVKTLVNKLNGDIKVESRLGEGSSFVVLFPAKNGQKPPEMDMFYQ